MNKSKRLRYAVCIGNGICCGFAAGWFGPKGAVLILLGELLAAFYTVLAFDAVEKERSK